MTIQLDIRQVADGAGRKQFVDLPSHLYQNDPHWVPALRSAQMKLFAGKTAFAQHAEMALFLAQRGGAAVGRVAAIHNRAHNEHHGDAVGFFGFFECDGDDRQAAEGLLAAAEGWLRGRGLTTIRGPVNPSMNGQCGLLIEGFDRPPMALMPYNPCTYPALLEALGFAKCKDLFAYLVQSMNVEPGTEKGDRLLRLGEAIKKRHQEVTLRTIDMSRYQEEVLGFMAVFEEARRNNWGYVPLTREEILETAHELRRVIDPEIVIIAEVQGRTAGALLAIPNINIPLAAVGGRLYPLGFIRFFRELKRVREVRILAMAALQHDRVKGITAALMVEALVRGLKRGYRMGEASWVLEDNHMSNGSIQGAADPILYKKYRIYEKAL